MVTRDTAVQMYRRMKLIRRFEEWVVVLVNANEIAGVTHEYIGQEAVAVGVCSALHAGDVIASTHRGHGHIIAKGGQVRRMMAELLGRATGYNRGRGGSMHVADLSLGIYGANGIVAAGVPIAMGAAWASQHRGEKNVAVPFFGDGAVNQGVLHESMNMAAVWKLPMLFICENNQYAVSTPIRDTCAVAIHERARAYGMPGIAVDGMDVATVYEAAAEAAERARAGNGPTLIECRTYRFAGHHTAEAAQGLNYRSQEEVAAWRARDPIELWAAHLTSAFGWRADERAAADASVEAELEEAVAFARHSPWPEPEEALDHMYAAGHEGLPARGRI